MSSPPIKKEGFGVDLKRMRLNNTTKKGYAISTIDAVEASSCLILVKIKKFAMIMSIAEIRMRKIVFLPDANNVLTEPLSKKINGNMIHTAIIELINKRVIGETVASIF